MEEYIAGKIYKNIEVDDRVTKDLYSCLYCYIMTLPGPASKGKNITSTTTDYKITLDSLKPGIKQCPSCKRIYLLEDPTE